MISRLPLLGLFAAAFWLLFAGLASAQDTPGKPPIKLSPTDLAPKAPPSAAAPSKPPASKATSPKSVPAKTAAPKKTGASKKKPAKKKKKAKKKRARRKKRKGARLCKYLSPIHKHLIIPGENLGEIAGRYGVTIKDLRRWNRRALKNPNRIRDGRTLRVCPLIPPRERYKVEYTVKKGDRFSTIAKKFKLSQDELFAFQAGKLKSRARIRAGKTKLIVWQDGDVIPAFAPESDKGKLKYSARLRPHSAYWIKRPRNSYGTRKVVQLIASTFEKYRRKYKGPKVVMGDLSKKGGGPLAGHVSHQKGRDVDIGWVFKKGKGSSKRFVKGTEKNLDIRRTWAMLHAFLKTEQIEFMFIDYSIQKLLYEEAVKRRVSKQKLAQWFQYPRPKARLYGIVRHWKGHADHVHIRFRKGG
jgi:LysM repeat protein